MKTYENRNGKVDGKMGAPKRRPATMKVKPKEEVNKKALIWIGAVVGVVFVAIAALLIFTS